MRWRPTRSKIQSFWLCHAAVCPWPRKLPRLSEAPLDLILVRKIGVPFQPELALGAVVDGPAPVVVRNEDVITLSGVSENEFAAIRDQELLEIERRRKAYLGNRPHPELAACTVIVVDDGIATGATIRAALQAVRARKPRKLVLAVPVAPTDTLRKLKAESDETVCLEDYENFGAIGLFYSDFGQVSDEEVIDLLARHPIKQKKHLRQRPHKAQFVKYLEVVMQNLDSGRTAIATVADITSILGNIDEKLLAVLSLRPTTAELEEVSVWLSGDADVFGANEPVKGNASHIITILTAEEEEYPRAG